MHAGYLTIQASREVFAGVGDVAYNTSDTMRGTRRAIFLKSFLSVFHRAYRQAVEAPGEAV
jgi:hypothetical protein